MRKIIQSNAKKISMSIVIASALMFTSCEKEGPEGPAGPAGKDGTANIMTDTYTTTNSDWSFDAQYNTYDAVISAPSITQDIAANGTIQMFIEEQGSYIALPFIFNNAQFNYGYEVGEVSILASLADGSVPNNPGGMTFKLVVIPPASLVEGIDHTNYETLQTVYGVE